MKSIKKKSILMFLIIFSVCILATGKLYSYISCNGSGGGYGENTSGSTDKVSADSSIETYVTYSAAYYLKGQGYIKELLNRVEMQDVNGLDPLELQQTLDKAQYYMANAGFIYERLVYTAEVIPYNPEVITRLKAFDYTGFMLQYRLNQVVFKELAAYLSAGNITATFKYMLSKVKAIDGLLNTIRYELNLNRIPRLELFWQLNELCANTDLFGSYAARIFYTLK